MGALYGEFSPGAEAQLSLTKRKHGNDQAVMAVVKAACAAVGKFGKEGEDATGWTKGLVGKGVCYDFPMYALFQAGLIAKGDVMKYKNMFDQATGKSGYGTVGLADAKELKQADLEKGTNFDAGSFIFFETGTTPYGHACLAVGSGYVVSANNMIKDPTHHLAQKIMQYGNASTAILGSLHDVRELVDKDKQYTVKATPGPFWRLKCFTDNYTVSE